MRNILAIFRKDLRVTFTTPVAYVALTVFTIVSSFFFVRLLSGFQRQIMRASQMQPQLLQHMNFTDMVLQRLFYNIAVILVFVIPFVTMRLIAEERRSRTRSRSTSRRPLGKILRSRIWSCASCCGASSTPATRSTMHTVAA